MTLVPVEDRTARTLARKEPERSGRGPIPRAELGIVATGIVVLVMVQRWGLITHDSRLDLLLDPGGFLSATWNMWDPTVDMGRIQNQAVGYLFPMGPFMLLGSALGLSPWIVERAWIALLLVVAMWGMVRLLEAMRIGSHAARLFASLAFAFAPFFIVRAGTLSVFVQGAAFMPWMLLALVKGSRGGSPRRAAAASGVAVLCMGGANAVVVGAALVPGALWLVTRQRGARRTSLATWWIVAVILATTWWVLPLVYQGRYGIDFLAFTERADVTTAFTPPFEVLRGVADWLSHHPAREAPILAGRVEVDAALVILGGAVVVAVGLYGMARLRSERAFLLLTLLAGVVLVGAGYGGALGNPAADEVVQLLDGPLGPLRNVHKFAPVVLLPVAIGVASGFDGLVAAVRRRSPSAGPFARRAVPAALGLAIIAAGWPLFSGDLLHQRGFSQVPGWWDEAKAYADGEPGRTLIFPGLPLSSSSWGFTAEDPFEWGTSAEWAVRQIAPLGSAGATEVLDTVEQAVEGGGADGLPAYLRRAGFSSVLVRNDADWRNATAPSPLETAEAMRSSGFELAASFGPPIPLSSTFTSEVTVVHPIDVYAVPDAASMQPASTTTVGASAVVSGDAGTPLSFTGTELEDRAVVMASDWRDGDPVPPRWLVTDENQRRYTDFGLTRANESYVLTADEPAPGGGDVSHGFLPTDRVADQTVAVRRGISEVTASSYGAWLASVPELGPQQAIDADSSTAWAAAPELDPERQWIELRLDDPTDVREVEVRLLAEGPWRPRVTALEISTENGSLVTGVAPDESAQLLPAPAGPTSWVRVRFASVDTEGSTSGPGLRELAVPGVAVDQRLAVPDQMNELFADPARTAPSYWFRRSTADPRSILRSDEEVELHREWDAPRAADMTAEVAVSAVPDEEWLGVAGGPLSLTATASSTFDDVPEFGAANLVDGDPGTWWIAADVPEVDRDSPAAARPPSPEVRDPEPTVVLTWDTAATVDSLQVGRVATASSPASVRVVSDGGDVREAPIDADGLARFPALTAHRLEVSFPEVAPLDYVGADGSTWRLPLTLSSLTVPVSHRYGVMDASTAVTIPCGEGPTLVVDGERHRLSISTTVGEVARLAPIPARLCGDDVLALDAGGHRLDTGRGVGGWGFAVDSVRLDPVDEADGTGSTAASSRPVEVGRWDPDHREVRVEAGPEAYLVVDENANDGWTARLDGEALRPVTIDGWKQGYVVPAGDGGLVTLTYGPTTDYRRALVIGALLVVLLAVVLVVPSRRELPPPSGTGQPSRAVLLAALVLAGIVLGGPLVVLVVPLLMLQRAHPRWLPWVAGGSFVVAGLAVAASPSFARGGLLGASGWIAVVTSVLAVLAVGAAVVGRHRDGPSGPGPEPPELPSPPPPAHDPPPATTEVSP